MFQNLGKEDFRLDGITVIRGVGLSSNVYVLQGEEITLIDTGVGDEYNRLDKELEQLGVEVRNVTQVVLTHTHPDHFGGLLAVQGISSPRILVHRLDGHALDVLDLDQIRFIEEGEEVIADKHRLKVIHTPGHTAGSICLFDEVKSILFSGDTVFPNGFFGRTDFPTGDSLALVESLRRLTEIHVESLLAGHEEPVIREGDSHIRLSYEMAKQLFAT
jgi:glyoxylase-like metal-dependent hydrolase (beta-lactamase superfamily II)